MTKDQKIIRNKIGLLNLAEELGNVSRACKVMGYSRDTFYRYRSLVEEGGFEALIEKNRKKPNRKNRTAPEIEAAVVAMATDEPAYGQTRVANELRKRGTFISAAGVRCVWLRHDLQTFKKRLAALEKKVAAEGLILTEAQVTALEKKKQDDVACGEIDTQHPGYLGSQDTFYVGTLKGVGRIYQQTFVDTYSSWAAAKLYKQKVPITAADLLNDRVLPFFESEGVSLSRILTDRGTEFCGRLDAHPFELYLAVNDIDHTKTKVKSPQTNGICERFHKTILQEFYQVTFRKKLYQTIEELQVDLDAWMGKYNERRTHQGKRCLGRTPLETFRDGINIWKEKQLGQQAA
jgi:transposase InsO family protein